MNKLPLPRYYDGQNWNTVFKPTRKSIPKYLHEDLPELKLIELKERFKQIGKFNCPRLEYFDAYIRKHKTLKDKKPKTSRQLSQKKEYDRMEEELQYALLLCDRESPVLDEVVSKSRSVMKPQQKKNKEKGRYFPDTINLVFRNRKSLHLSLQKKKQEQFDLEQMKEKIDKIQLLPFK